MVKFNLKDFFKNFIVDQFWKRFIIMLLGIILMGFFLSFLRSVGWGTDPYTFQNDNIRKSLGITLGTWQLVFNAMLFIFVLIFNFRLIGFGTIANWILIGFTADFFNGLWDKCIPEAVFTDPVNMGLKILIFAAGIIGFVISAAFYMNADMGLSPYDACAKIICNRLNKIPFFISRICYDLFAIVIGLAVIFISKRNVDITLLGSIIIGFALGPAIQIVGNFMNKIIFRTTK